MPRIFVAIPLPAGLARTIAALIPEHPVLRPVDPALLHFTLAFVGNLHDDRVHAVTAAVTSAAGPVRGFGVPIDTVGRFPARGAPRVVWAGTADPAAGARILELGATVRAELARQAIPFDAKPLLPHVTVARVRDEAGPADRRDLQHRLSAVHVPPGLSFVAESVHVMESVLGPKGPRYTSRAEIALA